MQTKFLKHSLMAIQFEINLFVDGLLHLDGKLDSQDFSYHLINEFTEGKIPICPFYSCLRYCRTCAAFRTDPWYVFITIITIGRIIIKNWWILIWNNSLTANGTYKHIVKQFKSLNTKHYCVLAYSYYYSNFGTCGGWGRAGNFACARLGSVGGSLTSWRLDVGFSAMLCHKIKTPLAYW